MKQKKYKLVISMLIAFLMTGLTGAQEKPGAVMDKLTGKWIMQKTRLGMQEGTFVFHNGGKYELYEKHPDGTGVTRKGAYRIQTKATPYRMVWGQDNLDAPGAEWTSNFAVFRILDDGRLEIKSSDTGDYPFGFAAKAEADEHTMILVKE